MPDIFTKAKRSAVMALGGRAVQCFTGAAGRIGILR